MSRRLASSYGNARNSPAFRTSIGSRAKIVATSRTSAHANQPPLLPPTPFNNESPAGKNSKRDRQNPMWHKRAPSISIKHHCPRSVLRKDWHVSEPNPL